MTFVTAWIAVAGLAAISIPILVHLLLRRRRKPIDWGAMRLLMEAVRRHRRRARVERILLLCIRCLILILLGLALAEPIIAGLRSLGGGSRLVVLVIDDGLVSGIRNESGSPELDESIGAALELVDGLASGDRIAVITSAHPPRLITDGPTINMDAASRLIGDLQPSASRSDLNGALSLAEGVVQEHAGSSPTTITLLGSWRKGALLGSSKTNTLDRNSPDGVPSDRPVRLLANSPASEPATVIVVSDISMRRPVDAVRGEQPQVRTTVTLRRLGTDLVASRSLVRLDGPGLEETLPRQVEWIPGRSEAVVEFIGRSSTTNSAIDGTSVVTAHVDSTTLPDLSNRSMLVDTSNTIKVGVIDRQVFTGNNELEKIQSAEWIERALEPGNEGSLEVERIDPASMSSRILNGLDALVLARPDLVADNEWNLIRKFIDTGGFLLVVPPNEVQAHTWLDRMGSSLDIAWNIRVEPVNLDEPVDLAVDQPGGSFLSLLDSELDQLASPVQVFRRVDVDVDQGDGRVLLQASDEAPFLIGWEPDGDRRGTVAMLTSAPHLEWTNLPIKPLMVPLMQELIREGTSTSRGSVEILAGDRPFIPMSSARELSGPSESLITVDQNGLVSEPVRRNGHWIVRDSSGAALSTIVVNSEVNAGDPAITSPDDLRDRLGVDAGWTFLETDELTDQFSKDEPNPVWSLLMLAVVLLLLVLETALNRRFTRSRVTSARTSAPSLGGIG